MQKPYINIGKLETCQFIYSDARKKIEEKFKTMKRTKMKTLEKILPHKNDKRPIAKFYRSWLEDELRGIGLSSRRGINEQQYRAADRLVSSYEKALSTGGWNPNEVSLKREYFRYHKTEIQVQYLRQFNAVFMQVGVRSREIIQHFCLDELGIRQYELKQIPKWPKGAGSARLREALDELAEIYKKLAREALGLRV